MYNYTLKIVILGQIVLHTKRFKVLGKYSPQDRYKTSLCRLEVYRTVFIHQRITGGVASLEWKIL